MGSSELKKWSDIHEFVIEVEEFIDWLGTKKKVQLAVQDDGDWIGAPPWYPAPKKVRDYLMEFYKVDAIKLEEERRALLNRASRDYLVELKEAQ